MSYSLELRLRRPVEKTRFLRHFADRVHYKITDDEKDLRYENRATGVFFIFHLRYARDFLFRKAITNVEVEVNYFRPSFFGLEAEIEISAFIAAFRPRVSDPQTDEKPYSRTKFLEAWNFGNAFAAHNLKSEEKYLSQPQAKLTAAWEWNYANRERSAELKNRRHSPLVQFFLLDGRPYSIAVWPAGVPISLPKVDYVLVGKEVDGKKLYGLATWSEVVEVVESSGGRFDVSKVPLDIEYFRTPPAIAKWIAEIPPVELDLIPHIPPYKIIDDEVIEAGKKIESVEAVTPSRR